MKTVNAILPDSLNLVEIRVFSDWHIGDKACNIKAITDEIEYVYTTPNAYAILNGDLMNNATKSSISDCYAETLTPQEALDKLTELLMPIKDKILFVSSGNHEDRTLRGDGIDLMACLSLRLGIEKKYCREGGVLFVKFGHGYNRSGKCHQPRPYVYSFYITHGSGGGKKAGGKINRLEDLSNIIDTDIYIHSHTHLPAIMKEDFYRTYLNNCKVTQVTKLFVNTASSLNYGGYGQRNGFKPACIKSPVIYLEPEGASALL